MSVAFELNEARYVEIMGKIIGEVEHLQNFPPKFIPEEDRVINHLLPYLEPHKVENGGPLKVQHITFVEKRGNLILEYNPNNSTKYVSFVGSHLDVVPANPADWVLSPFKLTQVGDKLNGRGTTDCLGNVALITDLFLQLAEKKPDLKVGVVAVFIASEENDSIPGVGIDALNEKGHLEKLKSGPLFWVDGADSQPCIGTASAITWTLRLEGKLFHSGLPHKAINPIELAMDATSHIQSRFYDEFPVHTNDVEYKFGCSSTLKPTQIKCSEGSLNQIPAWCEVAGDVRLTPFYDPVHAVARIEQYVEEIRNDLAMFKPRGPASKYAIVDEKGAQTAKLSIVVNKPLKGLACNLESAGYKAMHAAMADVLGEAKPYSVCGSLPLVGDLQAAGFDVQVTGFGVMSVYHGNNEYCLLSDMAKGMKVLCKTLSTLNASP